MIRHEGPDIDDREGGCLTRSPPLNPGKEIPYPLYKACVEGYGKFRPRLGSNNGPSSP